MRNVAVIGGGVAGLATALACARAGHEVTLFERDGADLSDPEAAFSVSRPGIPHFRLPHAFLARGVRELRRSAPDVYDALLEVGAYELNLAEKMPPGESDPSDDDLRFLGCRRPVLEMVMRKKVLAEENVEVLRGTAVEGLLWAPDMQGRVVAGVNANGKIYPADLVVDAGGRGSPVHRWVVEAGGREPDTETSECGLVYYSRYHRFRPGKEVREGPWLLGPRAELGYLELATFWGDDDTFAFVQAILPEDRELRKLRDPENFTRSLRAIPLAAPLVAGEVSEPITDVLAMGQLRNALRTCTENGVPFVEGLVSMGDSLCHTNPRYAWGLSLSLVQAFRLARCLGASGSTGDAVRSFYLDTEPEVRDAFEVASETDDARSRQWRGEPIDHRTPEGCLPLFLLHLFPVAGMFDRDIFRAAIGRLMYLTDLRAVEKETALLERAAALVGDFLTQPRPPQGPSREELVALLDQPRRAGAGVVSR